MYKKLKKILYIPAISIAAIGIAFLYDTLSSISGNFAFAFLAISAWILFFLITNKLKRLNHLEKILSFKNYTLDVMVNASNLFINLESSEEHYDIILNAAIEVIPNAHKGSFLILNPLTDRYEFKAVQGYNLDGLKAVSFLPEETFIYQNSKFVDYPVVIKDVRHYDSKFLDPHVNTNIENAGGLEVKEALSAPIVIDGQCFGILNIDSVKSDAFTTTDIQLIHFFASQISMALKHKQLVEESIQLNRYDKLTGAITRDHFEKILSAQRARTLENHETYALVLCDLNNLKVINDTYGHAAGDQLLTEFAHQIKSHLNNNDVFARIGGDEFILLFRNLNESQAQVKMNRIFTAIKNQFFHYHGHTIPISFSYGIAISPDDSMIYDILLKIADERMYLFKENLKSHM